MKKRTSNCIQSVFCANMDQDTIVFKKMSLSQSILEISDFTLEKNDPYTNLFNILIETFQSLENEDLNENIVFWYYECKILSEMGFMINIEDSFDSQIISLKEMENVLILFNN